MDLFDGPLLYPEWYQRPIGHEGLTFIPNVFSLGDGDQPAAFFREQKFLNMTFTAHLQPIETGLRHRQSVGISIHFNELQHQDFGVRNYGKEMGLCDSLLLCAMTRQRLVFI